MPLSYSFDPEIFKSLVGGRAVIETPSLSLRSREEAYAYLKTYGYDVQVEDDREKLWQIHARAVVYIRTQLLSVNEYLPEAVADPTVLGDISQLLLIASGTVGDAVSTGWACALLRVMHVISQLQNDLFTDFSLEIQEEITRPYRHFVQKTAGGEMKLVADGDPDEICLQQFHIKPFKDSDSAITKLLAKPDEVAFGLMDKIGVRFVTESLFDVFRVMRFLVRHHVVSAANVIASQSNNTLYPPDLFLQEMKTLGPQDALTPAEIDRRLKTRLTDAAGSVRFLEKHNQFTSRDYRFIKFITRQLIRVHHSDAGKAFRFFYPYEVQILNREHFEASLKGEASHDAYKARQRLKARQRVLPC